MSGRAFRRLYHGTDPTMRHTATVRITHWITAFAVAALLLSGVEILISHPRFYWGETGNVMDTPLFSLPIPSSRSTVPTGFSYVLPDQNGWSRYLHFQSAWLLLLAGGVYLAAGLRTRHFRDRLWPTRSDTTWRVVRSAISKSLRRASPSEREEWSYNGLQRMTYLGVIFVLFPMVVWTGLAMSDAFAAVSPGLVSALGGRQSARTLHFVLTVLLCAFLLVHVAMVYRAGFVRRVRAMITGQTGSHKEKP